MDFFFAFGVGKREIQVGFSTDVWFLVVLVAVLVGCADRGSGIVVEPVGVETFTMFGIFLL